MSYTPINWQNGDIITAEKMNKMDNGWGMGMVALFTQTVTCEGTGIGTGDVTYSGAIDADEVVITFDGVEYICQKHVVYDEPQYGAQQDEQGDWDFSVYPFVLVCGQYKTLYTETVGDHVITVSMSGVDVGDEFTEAVVLADALQITLGVTSYQEAHDAFYAGKNVFAVESYMNAMIRIPIVYVFSGGVLGIRYDTTSSTFKPVTYSVDAQGILVSA